MADLQNKQAKPWQLIVERSGVELWGRMKVNDNLIVDSALTIDELKNKMARLVYEFENIEVKEFEIIYELEE